MKQNFGDDLAYIEFDHVKVKTSKATLFVVGGDEYWIPNREIQDESRRENIFAISKRLAKAKGLEGAYE